MMPPYRSLLRFFLVMTLAAKVLGQDFEAKSSHQRHLTRQSEQDAKLQNVGNEWEWNNANPVVEKKTALGRRRKRPPKFVGMAEAGDEEIVAMAAHWVTFSCKVKAYPKAEVTWLKDDQPLEERRFEPYEFTKWNMTIKNVAPSDEGTYTCKVSNTVGSTSRRITLKVITRIVGMKPIIRNGEPGNHTALVGSDIKLKCEIEAVDNANPPVITWMRHIPIDETGALRFENGTLNLKVIQSCSLSGLCGYLDGREMKLSDYQEPYKYGLVSDATSLTLSKVTLQDSGAYSCMVENDIGRSFSTGWIVVLKEPPIIPEVKEAKEAKTTVVISAGTSVPGAIILTVIAIVVLTKRYNKHRKAKFVEKELEFREKTMDVMSQQLKKKVLIEKQKVVEGSDDSELGEPLQTVKVSVSRCSSRQPSESETIVTMISDLSAQETIYELESDPNWEVDRTFLRLGSVIGEGAFGSVVSATIPRNQLQNQDLNESLRFGGCYTTQVAVKMLKEGHSDEELVDLVKEMEIMKMIGKHQNIVNLLGVCTGPAGKPLYLILEFAEDGNLKDYLTNYRRRLQEQGFYHNTDCLIQLKDMLNMGFQVARGMEFLSSRKCIHRDLAARNILVSKNLVLKIADFGMARETDSTEYYRKIREGKLPLKWMAPESIFERISTTKSDVYSYGVLLWEIFTLGEAPCKSMSFDVYLQRLSEGHTLLSQPPMCPDEVFQQVMAKCLKSKPEERPKWTWIVDTMRQLYLESQPLEYLPMNRPLPDQV